MIRERLLRAAKLLCALALALVHPAAAQAPSAEAVLVELQLGRIATRTVEAYRAGDAALVPLTDFFDLAEIRALRRADGGVEATVQPGNVPLVLDPATRTLRLGGERLALRADELVVNAKDLYLATGVLGRAFALEWAVSWPDLQVSVVEPENLPVARRIRREAMLRAQLAATDGPQLAGLRLDLERPAVNGLVVDYSLLAPSTGLEGGAYSGRMGLDLFGGSFIAGLESQGPGRGPRSEISWTGVWRESPWLAQLQLGDGIATGPRPRSVRGVALSNSPWLRPALMGVVPFGGQLGQGWTVEAYRGGRLIGFDSVNALGRFTFDVPIEYGENPVDFVAYGPFGEVRQFNQTYRMRPNSIPSGKLEYGLSLGACRTDRCTANGNVDLRYGLGTRWTLRAGMDQFWRDSLGTLAHPYAGVVGTITNAVQLEADVVANAVMRGLLRFEPSLNLQLQLEANRFARGVAAPILTPQGRESQLTLSTFWRPSTAAAGNYLEATVDRIAATSGDLLSARFGGSLQRGNVRLLPAVRLQRQVVPAGPTMTQTFVGFNSIVLPQASLGGLLGQMTVRTAFEVDTRAGVSTAAAYVGVPFARWFRIEAGASWFRGAGTSLTFLGALELPTVRSYTTVTSGGTTGTLATQYVAGSAVYNPARHGVDFNATTALSRGGLTGRVFLDANANGRFDRGEEPLPGVRVIVGPTFASSDSSGTYHAWDVLPYEPVSVTVDSTTLASPLWVPAYAMSQVEPSPNRYRQLDIPVLPGGVLEGRVTQPDGAAAPGGLVLVLRHAASGERRVATTFGDGSFYVMGLRPGDWELAVDPKTLAALNRSAEPVRFHVDADPNGASVEGMQVTLR